MHKVRTYIILLLFAVFITGNAPRAWLLTEPQAVRCVLHHFFHANIFHLAVNCLAVWTMFPKGWSEHREELLVSFAVGSLSALAAPWPVIGFSNTLFSVLGYRAARYGWYRTAQFVVLVAAVLLTAFIPGISGLTHILSLAGGFAASMAASTYRKLSSDYGKARGDK